ncbi:DNA replication/repair protein RecF [Ruminococcaceae bacterium OttesenSCG-928-L11]|nr:DNA replication/repair protein RecF [Ruminococcaceae bacterium OttesenSCG-928-L11]
MNIQALKLERFRNIRQLEFSPVPGANVIYGDNAQGKTNILEAVWLFTGGKSFRGGKDSDFIRFGEENTSLQLEFSAGGRPQTAAVYLGEGRKNAFLNEIKQPSIGKLMGEFCAVFFSPDHLLLVKQGPEYRRRLIDTSLCQAYPKYAKILDSYQKILRQRASLLRDIPRSASLLDMLDVWDNSLVEYGGYITAVRAGYVKRLAEEAREVYAGISDGRETLGVCYRTSYELGGEPATRQEFTDAYRLAVRRNRGEDIAHGSTMAGPHRDDIDITIDGSSARSFGSQGQQRSCVLALKLAECALLEQRNGEPPVVLLDDVMSELDESRRGYLLNRLEGKQILITCCDVGLFRGLREGAVYHISNGALLEEPRLISSAEPVQNSGTAL